MAIEGVISDMGNVLLNFDSIRIAKGFAKYSPYSARKIYKIIFTDGLDLKYHKGLETNREFYKKVEKNIKIDIPFNKFKEIWRKLFFLTGENKKVMKLLKKVKEKNNIKLAILSNNNKIHFEEGLANKFIDFKAFKTVVLSYKIKSIKPEKRIYLTAVKRLKLKPEECIYIDDIKDFVKVANKLGLKGIYYNAQEKGAYEHLKQEFIRLGLKV